MSALSDQLQERTMQFALDVCALIKRLPASEPGSTVRHQLAKSSTSVAMNYRSSCRARSHAEFTARVAVVADEADESLGWLQFIARAGLNDSLELPRLIDEATQLTAIFSATVRTARRRQRTDFR